MKIKYLALFSVLFVSACGDNEDKNTEDKETPQSNVEQHTVRQDSSLQGFDETKINLPSPLQIALLFQESGMAYDENYTLSKSYYNEVDHSETNSLLCLGAYAADLAYNSLHAQEAASFENLDLINIISEDLGFGNNLNTQERIFRFEKNIQNIDSMAHLIAELEYDIEGYIRTNHEQSRAVAIFAGAWIETLELARQSFSDDGNSDIAYLIMEQQHVAADLLEMLNSSDNPGAKSKLIPVVENLNAKLAVFNLDGDELEISQADFDALLASIEDAHKTLFTA